MANLEEKIKQITQKYTEDFYRDYDITITNELQLSNHKKAEIFAQYVSEGRKFYVMYNTRRKGWFYEQNNRMNSARISNIFYYTFKDALHEATVSLFMAEN